MSKIRFRDFVLTPEEKAQLFEKYAQESGPGGLKALKVSTRNLRSPKELEVPALDPGQVARDLGHPVEYKHAGARYVADGVSVTRKDETAK